MPWRILSSWLVLCVLAGILRAAPAAAPNQITMTVGMADGSHVTGVPETAKFNLQTSFADVTVSMAAVSRMEMDMSHILKTTLRNGDQLVGLTDLKELALNTNMGKIAVPFANVHDVRITIPGQTVMPEGLVLYYTFDSRFGNVRDESESRTDGTLHGANYTDSGKSGAAMELSGNQSAVVINDPSRLRLQDFTIAMWIKRSDMRSLTGGGVNGDGVLFGFGQNGYALIISAQGNTLALTKVGINSVSSNLAVNDDQWHHVAMTKTGNTVVFYLDGTPSSKTNYGTDFTFQTGAAVGARGDNFMNGFKGSVDEVMFFQRALTDDEINQLYEQKR